MVPIPIPINVSNACYQKEFLLFSFSRLLTANWCKFLQKILSKFFRYWGFFCLLNFNECKETAFSSKLISSHFNSCLMLKVFKLQIISDRNAKKKKKISHKNYLELSQGNPSWKSSLRKLDLSCRIEMCHFEGLL